MDSHVTKVCASTAGASLLRQGIRWRHNVTMPDHNYYVGAPSCKEIGADDTNAWQVEIFLWIFVPRYHMDFIVLSVPLLNIGQSGS